MKTTQRLLSCALLAVVLGSSSLHAEMTVKTYREFKKLAAEGHESSKALLSGFFGGISVGFMQANVVLVRNGQHELFCTEALLAPDKYMTMLDKAILNVEIKVETITNIESVSVSILLLDELVKTFPCKGRALSFQIFK